MNYRTEIRSMTVKKILGENGAFSLMRKFRDRMILIKVAIFDKR